MLILRYFMILMSMLETSIFSYILNLKLGSYIFEMHKVHINVTDFQDLP